MPLFAKPNLIYPPLSTRAWREIKSQLHYNGIFCKLQENSFDIFLPCIAYYEDSPIYRLLTGQSIIQSPEDNSSQRYNESLPHFSHVTEWPNWPAVSGQMWVSVPTKTDRQGNVQITEEWRSVANKNDVVVKNKKQGHNHLVTPLLCLFLFTNGQDL